jgi:hypothetical protein
MDTMKYFNGIPEVLEESLERLDEIGGPNTNTNYPWGWAQAGNTPLKRYKQNTHGGGIRDPLVIHWPRKIKDTGKVRSQYHHVTDIVPTILEEIGIEAPREYNGIPQMPIHGTSLAYTFPAENADSPTTKHTQYFEMFGHRGIWHNGWKAVTFHPPGTSFDDDRWELYHIETDFSECNDLAEQRPDKLKELTEIWWTEAGKYGVLPLDDNVTKLFRGRPKAFSPKLREKYVLYPPISHVNMDAAPTIGGRSFTMTVDINRKDETSNGVLVAYGAATSGLSLYIKDGFLVFDYNLYQNHCRVASSQQVPVGRLKVTVRFQRVDRTSKATLLINEQECGTIDIPGIMSMISAQGMDVGRDSGSPVTDDYKAPFPFSGEIHQINIDIPKRLSPQQKKEIAEVEEKVEMGRQ